MERNFIPPQIMQQILSIIPNYCDKCGSKHQKADLEVIESENSNLVCKLNCTTCKNVYMIHVTSTPDGVISAKGAKFKLDISDQEMKKFSGSDQIAKDEILDVFIALKEVQTLEDFDTLFTTDINN